MQKELAHSFNAKLSKEISDKLKNEQEKLRDLGFIEKRFYDSSPHLAIATKFMSEKETEKFIGVLKNEFKNDESFELEFSDFKLSRTRDYIFLHLNFESEQKILDLHSRAFQATKNIGLEIQTGKTFRHFEYNPHISIIKLPQEEIGNALEIIKEDFSGIKMLVNCFEITRQTDDEKGFSNFPVINKIDLG
jgi:2'-5' RNA ligase